MIYNLDHFIFMCDFWRIQIDVSNIIRFSPNKVSSIDIYPCEKLISSEYLKNLSCHRKYVLL